MQVNYFYPLKFEMTVPLFTEQFYGVKGGVFFFTKFAFWPFIFSKTEIQENHPKRTKVDNLIRLFID